jgi:hypothetical protein
MGRGFLRAALLWLIIVAAPLVAEAQPEGKVWRIGLFHVGLDHVPPSLNLQGRVASRTPRPPDLAVRVRDQPEDREDAGGHHSAVAAAPRGQSHRVI